MDGVLNIRKEKGFTSFDVVAKLRGILHMKKNRTYRDTGSGSRRCASGSPWQSDQTRRTSD